MGSPHCCPLLPCFALGAGGALLQLSPALQVPPQGTGWYSLQVAAQLLLAATGPVEAMEGCLHQGRHDAAQPHLITAAVALPVMLHAQPVRGAKTASLDPHLATLTCQPHPLQMLGGDPDLPELTPLALSWTGRP